MVMADTQTVLSVIGTMKSRLPDISIKDGQLIFIQDVSTIALDLHGKRNFFNQIVELSTDEQRQSLLAPVNGIFYFVVNTAVLWTYQHKWIQITTPPKDIMVIGTQFPQLGVKNTLYINTEDKSISIWDAQSSTYDVVSDKTQAISTEEIQSLFS